MTFEEMRGFWPNQIDDQTGVTNHLNRVQKYVVSSSVEDPDWDGTSVRGLTLEEARTFSGGVALLRYTMAVDKSD
nr:hypothetical protein [Micromonospora sp. DSM 115978]